MAVKQNDTDLTIQQEKFVNYLVQGKSQREAYKLAFQPKKMKDEVVDVRACELFAVGKIKVRYQELLNQTKKEIEKTTIATKEQILEELTAMGFGTKKFTITDMFGNDRDAQCSIPQRQKALELLGKFYSLFTDNVKVDLPINIDIKDDFE